MTATAPILDPAPTTEAAGHPWRTVATVALLVSAIADIAVQVLARAFIPPVAVFALLALVAAVLVRRPGKAGPIFALVVSLLALLAGAPFAAEGLAHPESPVDFLHGFTGTVVRLIAAVAALGALRHWSTTGARRTGTVFAALGGLAVLAAVIVPLTAGSDAAQAGDTEVVAERAEWAPGDVTVPQDGAVLVDNRDGFRHTFAVEDTDVEVELPAWSNQRVSVDLPAGTYRLICTVPGHESMTGTLTVSG